MSECVCYNTVIMSIWVQMPSQHWTTWHITFIINSHMYHTIKVIQLHDNTYTLILQTALQEQSKNSLYSFAIVFVWAHCMQKNTNKQFSRVLYACVYCVVWCDIIVMYVMQAHKVAFLITAIRHKTHTHTFISSIVHRVIPWIITTTTTINTQYNEIQ